MWRTLVVAALIGYGLATLAVGRELTGGTGLDRGLAGVCGLVLVVAAVRWVILAIVRLVRR